MKKAIVIFTVLLLAGFLLVRGVFERPYHHAVTRTTDLSNENIEGMVLADDIKSEKVISKCEEIKDLDSKNSIFNLYKYGEGENDESNSLFNYYILKEGVEIATDKGDSKIIRFILTKGNVKTSKGVGVGDSIEKAVESYGDRYYKRIEQGLDIIGYVDKDNEYSIEFWYADDKILIIRFDYNHMG